MRIQYFNGGLANQVFQYIFYRFNEIRHPEKDVWFLDDSFFYFKKEHNGYELERIFGVKPNLLSSQFDPAAWDAIIKVRREGKSVAEFFRNAGESSFRDLQLMTMCNGLIMSNSAFCYLAALLNPRLSLFVNPSPVRKI